MAHHPLGRLDSYLEGRLTPRVRARIAAHVQRCPMCASAARERQQVLAAAWQTDPDTRSGPAGGSSRGLGGPAPAVRGHPEPGADDTASAQRLGAVMARGGRSGRIVVTGLSAAVLGALALAGLWTAGAPEPTSATSLRTAAERARTVSAEQEGEEEAEEGLGDLRRAGWSVPSLYTAGLEPTDVRSRAADGVVELEVLWTGAADGVRVRECRSESADREGQARPPQRCPSEADGARAGSAPEPDRAIVARTAGTGAAIDYRVLGDRDAPTEPWSVAFDSAGARYVVSSQMPRDRIRPVLSLLSAADRARVQEAEDDDGPGQRLRRGLDRVREAVPLAARIRGPFVGAGPSWAATPPIVGR